MDPEPTQLGLRSPAPFSLAPTGKTGGRIFMWQWKNGTATSSSRATGDPTAAESNSPPRKDFVVPVAGDCYLTKMPDDNL